MNYVIILAAGLGKRMSGFDVPKQFLELKKNMTVLEHTVRNFLSPWIGFVLIVAPLLQLELATEIARKIQRHTRIEIAVCRGGRSRNHSLKNALLWLQKNREMVSDDVLITHDAARTFTEHAIIMKNAKLAKKHGACATIVRSKDTVAQSKGKFLSLVLSRDECVLQQTPQTFTWEIATQTYLKASNELLEKYTDACGLLSHFGFKIAFAEGSNLNFKITDLVDYCLAKTIVRDKRLKPFLWRVRVR